MGSASAFPFSMMKIMRQSTEQWWVAEGETAVCRGGSNVTREAGNMTIPKGRLAAEGVGEERREMRSVGDQLTRW